MAARSFVLVLAGGGARGYAHAGVLRGLQHIGLEPAGLVGVSMGAIVAATYSLREDWYQALLSVDLSGAPPVGKGWRSAGQRGAALRRAWSYAHTTWNMVTGWGAPDDAVQAGRSALDELLGAGRLEDGRVPLTVCATDLRSGTRVELSTGPAASAVYASSALAGVFPPLEQGDALLVDGVYADMAPVDVARRMSGEVVIVVDPSQGAGGESFGNGLQVVMRAMEICHLSHAHLRVDSADLILRPVFDRPIEVLNFDARRECVAAGIREVRARRADLEAALCSPSPAEHA
ncbi:MAG: patatin-like phospholipase family protein [Gemmatimonadota bacterium]|nr:patatin-like phospholipase family protein [Gemmatimonadota bacterium]MDH3424415.1 patatin-like phospholipase family protein [Gemmatimonadota bacterium]